MYNKTVITVYRIGASRTNDEQDEQARTKAQRIAIDKINADDTILKDYYLQLKELQSVDEDQQALVHALSIAQNYSSCDRDELLSPIVLGSPWSSHSVLTSRVFNIYHMLQISATATSPTLSGEKYRSFFRTIANDDAQGKQLVRICRDFHWTRIAVIYQNDNYGQNLFRVIQDHAEKAKIEVHSMAVTDADSLKDAAQFIQKEQLYISILVMQASDIQLLMHFSNVSANNSYNYPYYAMGTDAWFNTAEIGEFNLTNATQGSIGTMPFYPALLSLDDYIQRNIYGGNVTIYNKAKKIHDDLMTAMADSSQHGPSFHSSNHHMMYAHDAVYAKALALDMYAQQLSYSNETLEQVLADCSRQEEVQQALHAILLHNVSLVGATGLVQFDETRGRANGIFVPGYMTNANIKILSYSNESACDWTRFASQFKEHENCPQSEVTTEPQENGIAANIYYAVNGYYALIMLLALVLSYLRRQHETQILYISMVAGIALCWIFVILYGLQRLQGSGTLSNHTPLLFDVLCTSNMIVICVAFTVTFLTLVTTHSEFFGIIKLVNDSLSRKTEKKWKYKGESARKKKLFWCVLCDMLFFGLFLIAYGVLYHYDIKLIEFKFLAVGAAEKTDNALQRIQHSYPVCSNHTLMTVFFALLFLYKLVQIVWVIDKSSGMFIGSLIFCIALAVSIATFSFMLTQMLKSAQITRGVEEYISSIIYIILACVLSLVYVLWLAAEYMKCGANEAQKEQDASSQITSSKQGDSGPTKTTRTSTTPEYAHDHQNVKQSDRICQPVESEEKMDQPRSPNEEQKTENVPTTHAQGLFQLQPLSAPTSSSNHTPFLVPRPLALKKTESSEPSEYKLRLTEIVEEDAETLNEESLTEERQDHVTIDITESLMELQASRSLSDGYKKLKSSLLKPKHVVIEVEDDDMSFYE